MTEPAEAKTISLVKLADDHESLCDAVHGMLGRLAILESRVLMLEKEKESCSWSH